MATTQSIGPRGVQTDDQELRYKDGSNDSAFYRTDGQTVQIPDYEDPVLYPDDTNGLALFFDRVRIQHCKEQVRLCRNGSSYAIIDFAELDDGILDVLHTFDPNYNE